MMLKLYCHHCAWLIELCHNQTTNIQESTFSVEPVLDVGARGRDMEIDAGRDVGHKGKSST